MIFLVLLITAMAYFWPYLWFRNNRVLAEMRRVIDLIDQRCKADLAADREWEWRWAEYHRTYSYNRMLFLPIPIKSFYKNSPFLQ